jgi:ceramide glucosyltransferase
VEGAAVTAAWPLASAYLALVAGKSLLAARVARREPAHAPSTGAAVAVAQAILSGDPRLANVLADNVRELPAAHFLWLVDGDDPAGAATCRAVAASVPAARIDVLVLPSAPAGTNPKLWKLEAARGATDAPAFLVLDDDTRMPAGTLAALVHALDRHDLATSLPVYRPGRGWPSRLLAQFVANNAAMTYLPLVPWLAPITINGMAYVLRRSTLDAMGGFAPLFRHLTDDLAVAARVRAGGGSIFQSARTHEVETSVRDGHHYRQLMHRWFLFALLLLRAQSAGYRLLITLLHGLPPLLLWAVLLSVAWRPELSALAAAAMTLVARAAAIVSVQRAIGAPGRHSPLISLASELLQPLHLLHAAVWRRITWRTRRYRVYDDRHFEAVE